MIINCGVPNTVDHAQYCEVYTFQVLHFLHANLTFIFQLFKFKDLVAKQHPIQSFSHSKLQTPQQVYGMWTQGTF